MLLISCTARSTTSRASLSLQHTYFTKHANYRSKIIAQSVPPTISKEKSQEITSTRYGKKALIVGGGPVGLACAMHMIKHGMEVEIYEKRPSPEMPEQRNANEFSVNLNGRSIRALEAAGVDVHNSLGQVNLLTKIIKIKNGKVQPMSMKDNRMYYFNRSELVYTLTDIISDMPESQKVKFHYNSKIKDLNLKSRQATFIDTDGNIQNENFDLLVGTDGVNSQVRDLLSEEYPEFKYDIEYKSKFIFRIAMKLSREGLENKMSEFGQQIAPVEKGKVLVNYADNRKKARLVGWTEDDGTCSILVYAPNDDPVLGNEKSSQEDFETFLTERWGDLIDKDWIKSAASQLAVNPIRTQGKLVRCNQFHGPNIILLGDAAHAITPLLGQGLNCGMEDCTVLADILDNNKIDFDDIPETYTKQRLSNIHALQDLEGTIYKIAAQIPMTLSQRLVQAVLLTGVLVSNFIGERFKVWRVGYSLTLPQVSQRRLLQRVCGVGGTVLSAVMAMMFITLRQGWVLVVAPNIF
eukprot:TRINITY_DN196_c0_g1_i1.p1 TRINITY_DN196_c0_g1~~TRINITY_DN196_c0_g1_i1.p1  ORF type:complete len:522 (-),score=52.86 TRINITY_DN196_c0_g1_i1:64-1629(-)